MARYDDLNTGTIAYATFISSVLLLVIILLVRALCYSWVEAENARKLEDAHYVSADTEISEQKSAISSYKREMVEVAPADESSEPAKEERVRIPIERAKELILKEHASSAKQNT